MIADLLLKVAEYHEGEWFNNNFAKVFSAYYFYAGVMTINH